MPKILVAVTDQRLTAAATSWIEAALFDGALAVDATVGNGYDTLFLAHRVGPKGRSLVLMCRRRRLPVPENC